LKKTFYHPIFGVACLLVLMITFPGQSVGQSMPQTDLIRQGEPTVVIYDREGRPGKWAFLPAPKIKAMQDFLAEIAPYLIGRDDISFRSASTGATGDKTADCATHSTDVPFGTAITPLVLADLSKDVSADGHRSAPAPALAAAVDDLAARGGGRIVFVTDGVDNCGGDPLLVAENAPPSVIIDVVALGQANQLHTLAAIPLAARGNFYLSTPPDRSAALEGQPPEAAPPGENSGADDRPGEFPDGDLVLDPGEATGADAANLSSPLFPGGGAGATRISVNTGVDACPAFDDLSRQLLDYSRGIDSAKDSGTPVPKADPVAVSIILDASGSMAARRGGKRKMDVALKALSAAIPSLDGKNAVVNLRAYGFDASVAKTPEASCPNTKQLVEFGRDQGQAISDTANGLTPYGYTPIAASLLAAGRDLEQVTARRRFAVLISDGEETCGGDPVKIAAALNTEGTDVNTFVVGYDLDAEQKAQMRAVAEAGGTEYLNAANGAELAKALREIVTFAAEKAERIAPTCSNPVAGGETPETATPILPGIYTVGELLEKGTFRYYRVASAEGQVAFVRGLIQSRRFIPGDDGMEEAIYALGSLTVVILNPDGSKIAGRLARESDIPGTSVVATYADTSGDGFIIGIGDNYDRVAPSGLFQITIEDASDAGNGDAGAKKDTADFREIMLGQPSTGHLGFDDSADVWRLDAEGETTIAVSFDVSDLRYRIVVFDEASGKRLARTRDQLVTFEANGPVRIQVESREPRLKPRFSGYEIAVITP